MGYFIAVTGPGVSFLQSTSGEKIPQLGEIEDFDWHLGGPTS
jgi:hypothetical protein